MATREAALAALQSATQTVGEAAKGVGKGAVLASAFTGFIAGVEEGQNEAQAAVEGLVAPPAQAADQPAE